MASSSSYQNKTAHVTEFFHGFQVALMGIIMTNMTQWIFAKCKAKRSSLPSTTWSEHFVKWRPVYLMCLSTVMVMFQPISILVIGSWQIGDPYNFYWTDDTKQTAFPNKAKGWVIQVLMTYGGFIVMFFGMNEALGLIAKFKKRWRATKAGMQASNAV